MPQTLIVEHSTRVTTPADDVWAWYARPGAFERLMPPWEHARVLSRTGGIENGAQVVIETRIGPAPVRWVARYREVARGRRFVDEQVEGPFQRWEHEHEMLPDGAGGCVIHDRITCVPPLGALGSIVSSRWLRTRLERLLQYRHETLVADLAAHAGVAPRRFVIAGSSGMIGSALVPFLTTGGHEVTRLVRRPPGPGESRWDPEAGTIDPASLAGADVVINLSGANVADGRWTAARKQELIDSRIRTTTLLASTMAGMPGPPATLVSVSASGFYGDRGDEVLTESSGPGTGFFPMLVQAWEGAATPAAKAGVRVAFPRFSVVLSPAGGALRKLLPPFLAGVGGRVGSGRQWMGWCSIDDAVGMLYLASIDPRVDGAFNAVAPVPVRNANLARSLGHALGMPALLPVPGIAIQLLFGELADATLLASARTIPDRLSVWGFRYRDPSLEAALRRVLGR
jgi:uncharacterized protein